MNERVNEQKGDHGLARDSQDEVLEPKLGGGVPCVRDEAVLLHLINKDAADVSGGLKVCLPPVNQLVAQRKGDLLLRPQSPELGLSRPPLPQRRQRQRLSRLPMPGVPPFKERERERERGECQRDVRADMIERIRFGKRAYLMQAGWSANFSKSVEGTSMKSHSPLVPDK